MAVAGVKTLHLADVFFPEEHPRAGQLGPVNAFLLTHPQGPVLVDTGLGDPHPVIDRLYRPQRRRLVDVLSALGIRLTDIQALVNTHLHFDHCGDNGLFPGKPIYVQATEYEDAGHGGYTLPERVRFPGADYRLAHGERQILSRISLVPTPGHTRGHESVLFETEEGRCVIAGQAAETAAEFALAAHGIAAKDESLQRLLDLYPSVVFFSHDSAAWRPETPS